MQNVSAPSHRHNISITNNSKSLSSWPHGHQFEPIGSIRTTINLHQARSWVTGQHWFENQKNLTARPEPIWIHQNQVMRNYFSFQSEWFSSQFWFIRQWLQTWSGRWIRDAAHWSGSAFGRLIRNIWSSAGAAHSGHRRSKYQIAYVCIA